MHLCEFIEDYNGAPMELPEVAHLATMVEDEPELSAAAKIYLHSLNEFLAVLDAYNFELG